MPPKFSNPTALGLASFAISLTVLSFANLGWMGAATSDRLGRIFWRHSLRSASALPNCLPAIPLP